MSINYKHRLKKKLEKNHGVLVVSKAAYGNQEELRLKSLDEQEFGFSEQLYFSQIYLIHLIQPYLKARYGAYLSKEMIQESKTRYAIKITNAEVDLIFIMNRAEIECILLDPLESFNIQQLSIDEDGQLIHEVCSFFILYHTCKSLDCLTIERYWDFIRTIAARYSFYPRMIFHEESIFDSEEFQLDSIKPGFCLYSGEPIKEGFFKDGKASSDFFNPRYSRNGLFGRMVLCYSESVKNIIRKNIEDYRKIQLGRDFQKEREEHQKHVEKYCKVTITEEELRIQEEYERENPINKYLDDQDEVYEHEELFNGDYPIKLDELRQESIDCAHELSKKVLHVSTKFNNPKQSEDISVNKILDLFGSYFLAEGYAEHFDFFDTLLLVPNMKGSLLKSFYKRESTTFGKRSLLERLIYKFSQIKKKHYEINKDFYEKILSNGKSSIPIGTLNKGEVEKLISLEELDFCSYPKLLNLYKHHDHNKRVTSIKFQYKDQIFLDLLNEILKLIKTSGSKDGLPKSRNHLITLGLFRFHRNIIEQKIKKMLQVRINQA